MGWLVVTFDERPGASAEVFDAYAGALLGAAVGDALGAPLEGRPGPLSPDRLAAVEASSSVLRHTDDTAMTVDVAESLLEAGGLDEDHLARRFASTFSREPYRGYGQGAASLLARIAAGADWRIAAREQFGGDGSFGNGAAMRVTAIALMSPGDPMAAGQLARRSARITHTHPLALDGAAIQAAATAVLLETPAGEEIVPERLVGRLHDVVTTGEHHVALERVAGLCRGATADTVVRTLGTGVAAVEAVPTALLAFLRHPSSFEDAVRFAVGLGGDTDTIGAMTGALAGAHLGRGAIPPRWIERLEMRPRLEVLARDFAQRHLGLH